MSLVIISAALLVGLCSAYYTVIIDVSFINSVYVSLSFSSSDTALIELTYSLCARRPPCVTSDAPLLRTRCETHVPEGPSLAPPQKGIPRLRCAREEQCVACDGAPRPPPPACPTLAGFKRVSKPGLCRAGRVSVARLFLCFFWCLCVCVSVVCDSRSAALA